MEINRFINFKDKWFITVSNLVLLAIIGFLLHWLGYLIYSYPFTPIYIKNTPESILLVVFLVYLVALFLLVRVCLRKFLIIALHFKNRDYIFNSQDWPAMWLFNGRPYTETASEFIMQSSRAGCLLKDHYWKNFTMTFEMKFIDGLDKKVGVVFRAEDLDNYFMLELSNKQNEIKPHVRYRGGWDVIYPVKTSVFNNLNFISVTLKVKNDTAYLHVNNHLELTWVLPTHVDVMYIESGSEKKSQETTPDERYVQEIPFRMQFGMIGFRAHPGQGATIRGLKIEPL